MNLPVRSDVATGEPRYRFGFVLNTTIGNRTRFENLRKYATRDLEVRCSWTPVTHLLSVDASRTLRGLPRALAVRLWVLRQMWPALLTLAHQDVVMLHLFEAEIACVARSYLSRRPAPSAAPTKRPSSILIVTRSTRIKEQAALAPKLSTVARPLARVTHRRLHSIFSVGRAHPGGQLQGPPRADFSDPRWPRP